MTRRRGCFVIFLILIVLLLINLWAFHMGGRWTPLLTWTGCGTMQSSTGARYALYVRLSLKTFTGRRSAGMGSDNLAGDAWICTPQSGPIPLDVSGSIRSIWLDTNGKTVNLRLLNSRTSQPHLMFDLKGKWDGPDLKMQDYGSLPMSFASDGTPLGYGKTTFGTGESAEVTLRYGDRSDFDTLCQQVKSRTHKPFPESDRAVRLSGARTARSASVSVSKNLGGILR